MGKIKKCTGFIVLFYLLFLPGCNDPASNAGKKNTDSASVITVKDTTPMAAYDPAMDPLIVGAPFIKKLADTLNVKMYLFTVKPGDSAAIHSHPDHAVYVLEGGKASISFNGAASQVMELKAGMGFVSGALTDAGKNIGTTTIKLLVTDIHRPRGD